MSSAAVGPVVSVDLLGNLAVSVDDDPVRVPSAKQAAILAVLALEAGQAVSPERLIEIVWEVEPDERTEHTLQQHVSSLRKLLEPGRLPRQEPTVVMTHRQGYALNAVVDLQRFEALAATGVARTAASDWVEAIESLDSALAVWRGPALADVLVSGWFDTAAARLEERRLAVRESRVEALLATDRHAELIPEIEALLEVNPYRERLWGQLMVALFRSGRQADAIAAFGRARHELVEELGLEPGAELRDLERRILDQDPTLLLASTRVTTTGSDLGDDLRETYRSGTPGTAGIVRLPDGQVVHLAEGRNLIGRLPGATIRLTDSRVSRTHAEIEITAGRAVLRDLGSTNGTFVDEEGVDDHVLVAGTVFSIGGVELAYLE